MKSVAVIGGGISGLTAAYRITKTFPDLSVTVFEASPRAGGLIHTERVDNFVLERGPDSLVTDKPAALRLAEELGMASQVIRTEEQNAGVYVVCRGKLAKVPRGFSVMGVRDPWALFASPILSVRGKLRALGEVLVPRRKSEHDESIATFVRRRYGQELWRRMAEPMVSGIYGGDPETLSIGATLPRFVRLERENASVTRGLLKGTSAREHATSGARYGMFVSFKGGMQTLPDALAARLGESVRLRSDVSAIKKDGACWSLNVAGQWARFDALVVAVPAWRAALLLEPVSGALSELLAGIFYTSSATVTCAWQAGDISHPLDAFGFVVPREEGRSVLASTWSSVKYRGRAPNGIALIRAFVGGAHGESLVLSEEDVLRRAVLCELDDLLGVSKLPMFTRIDRYERAMPQFTLGHSQRLEQIRREVLPYPTLALAGNAYEGVGIADAVQSGDRAAQRIVSALQHQGASVQ